MFVVFICCIVLCRYRLCDGLSTRPKESYRVSNCMCVIKKPQKGSQRSILDYIRVWMKCNIYIYHHLRFVHSTVLFLHPKLSFAICLCF
jgi:hypothetical protein